MGFKLTWLLIKGKGRAALFHDLEVKSEGDSVTCISEGTFGRAYRDDAYLVVAPNDLGRHLEPDFLCNLSRDANVLVCHIHEGCMYSHAARWVDGVEIWGIEHDSDQGIRHLDIRGEPPPELARIRATQEASQDAEPPKRPRAISETMPANLLSGFPPDLLQVIGQFGSPRAVPWPLTMGVDHIFDVPIRLCEALTGLRHDRGDFDSGPTFEVLVPVS